MSEDNPPRSAARSIRYKNMVVLLLLSRSLSRPLFSIFSHGLVPARRSDSRFSTGLTPCQAVRPPARRLVPLVRSLRPVRSCASLTKKEDH